MGITSPKLLIPAAATTFVVAAAGWAYWPTLVGLVRLWDTDPNYSQGFLVPVLALGLLAHRSFSAARPAGRPAPMTGLAALAVAAALRGVGSYYYVSSLDHLSLLVTVAGLVLMLAGPGWLRRGWPAVAVLVFALPVPASGGRELLAGLQTFATVASTYALQTLGAPAYREGNVIVLPGIDLGVVEACSGLKMLMVFCSLAFATAVLLPVGPFRKVFLTLSAVPLAVACNVARITAAGLAGDALGSDTGHFVFHDLAGWLMTPLAFALLAGEIVLLGWLFRPLPGAGGGEPARVPGNGVPAVA